MCNNVIISTVLVICVACFMAGCASETATPEGANADVDSAMQGYMEAQGIEPEQNQTDDVEQTEAVEVAETEVVVAESQPTVVYENPIGRNWQPQTVGYQDATVRHPTVYFADWWFEDDYSYGHDEYSQNDLISLAISPHLVIGEIATWPIQLFFALPWDQQQSRGGLPVETAATGFVYETPVDSAAQ